MTRTPCAPPALAVGLALVTAAVAAAVAAAAVRPGDWPMWGGSPGRNMAAPAVRLPAVADVRPGKVDDDTGEVDLAAARGVAWAARLGSWSYGNPTVAGGRVYVGTNNTHPRDPKYPGDRSVLLCLDERTGRLLWQLAVPKHEAGMHVDYPDIGLCSSPAVDGDRVYLVSNRCEVLCLDVGGLADGNAGPFTDEARYAAGRGKEPIPQGPGDADVVWRYDLRHELGVFPHLQPATSVLVVGDRVYAGTANGTDWTDRHLPAPDAPALVCLDKRRGRLVGQERSGISRRTFYANWSSPAYGLVGGRPTVVFGGGDGVAYGFDPDPAADGTLTELWRIDANPPQYRVRDGRPLKYQDRDGPSEVMATPVVYGGRVYVGVGRNPDAGVGAGCLTCIAVAYDAAGRATAAAAWRNTRVGWTMSAVSVGADGLLYAAESAGFVHCLDAATGAVRWTHDVEADVWGSTLLADGRVFVGTGAGELVVLAAGPQKRVLGTVDFADTIDSTPVAANRTLFVMTHGHLYALRTEHPLAARPGR